MRERYSWEDSGNLMWIKIQAATGFLGFQNICYKLFVLLDIISPQIQIKKLWTLCGYTGLELVSLVKRQLGRQY